MLYFTKVRWLSRGNVLKRFIELRAEVKACMEKDGMAVPVLSDPKWLMNLAFLVDISKELNVLNKKLQGQGQLVSRVGYRDPVPIWHWDLCNQYVPNRIRTQISVPHFGAMPERSVEIFVLCFSETDVRSIITGTAREK